MILEPIYAIADDCIEIDVSLNTFCNYHCPYCYARKEEKHLWNKFLSKTELDKLFTSISKSNFKVNLNILGGEPIFYPYLNYFLDKCEKCDNINEVTIFTNASKNLNFIHLIDKIRFLLAYHVVDVNDEMFLKNVEYLISKNIKPVVSILLLQSKKYFDKIKNFIETIKQYDVLIEYKHIFDSKGDVKFKYKIEDIPRYKYNGKLINVESIIKNNLNILKNCQCYMNHYDIEIDGSITHGCIEDVSNIFKEPDFFKNLKDYKVCCKRDVCSNYCWFDFKKCW